MHRNLEHTSGQVRAGQIVGIRHRLKALASGLARCAVVGTFACAQLVLADVAPAAAVTADEVGALPVGQTSYPVPSGARFVSPSGADTNAGTQASPLRTLGHAVASSPAGSTIVLRQGTYREQVQFYNKTLTIQPYPGEAVWMSGSDVVSGWVADGSVWRKDGWTAQFSRTDTTGVMVDPAYPMAGWPDMVFFDGAPRRQVASRSEVVAGTFYVDYAEAKLFVGDNPSGRTVEASTRAEALYVNTSHNSVVRGLGFKHYATPISRMGAVKGYANGLTFENNVFANNALAGLSVIGADAKVVRNTMIDNGQLGYNSHKSDRQTVHANLVRGNNNERFVPGQAAGGMKITASRSVSIRDNIAELNHAKGIWVDVSAWDVSFVGNLVRGNSSSGLMFEISANAIIVDNVVVDNGDNGVYVVESSDVEIWNNTIIRNRRNISVLEGTRTSSSDPAISHDVDRVTIRNNVLSQGRTTTPSLFGVDDVRKLESGTAMGVSSDYNAYYRSASTTPAWIANWSNWPTNMIASTTLAGFRTSTGQELHSLSTDGGTNPYVSDEASGSYWLPLLSPAKGRGLPLPARIATAVGVAAGTPVDIGVLWGAAPNTPPTASFTSSCKDLSCSFDGGASQDPEGAISWSWNFGDGTTATGSTSARSFASGGTYTVSLTVVDTEGAVAVSTQSVSVSLPVGNVVSDAFTRTVADGWGSASPGGSYAISTSVPTDYAVNGGTGTMRVPAGAGRVAYVNANSARDVDMTLQLGSDKVSVGGTYGQTASLVARRVAANTEYRTRLRFAPDGKMYLAAVKLVGTSTETMTGGQVLVPGLSHIAASRYLLRSTVTGANPSTIQAKVWPVGQAEPTDWLLNVSDGEPALQEDGLNGVVTYLSGATTNAPVTFSFDDFNVTSSAAMPVPSPPPAPTGLAATATSSSSINLTWTAAPGARSYKVERSRDDGTTWAEAASGVNTTSFGDTALLASTRYTYRVRATNTGGDSPPSEIAAARTRRK